MVAAVVRWAGVLLLGAVATAAAAAPKSVSASYALLKNGQEVGVVNETYRQNGNQYQIVSETRGVGIYALFNNKGAIKLVSRGEVTKKGLRPLHFEHHRGSDPKKLIEADFDWAKNELTLRHGGETETVALKPDTQDRLSLMYQFMFLSLRKPGDLAFSMTNGRKLDDYRYRLKAREELNTPLGPLKTLRYEKVRSGDEDGTEFWLAPGRFNFPVRIVIEEHGGRLEQNLKSLAFE